MKLNATSKALILANAATIALALLMGFDFATLMWMYWLESVLIGAFAFMKLLTGGLRNREQLSRNALMAGFFAVHYGMFHIGYLVFLITIPWFAIRASGIPGVVIGAWILLASHAFSFYENVYKRRDEMPAGIRAADLQFIEPYKRIVPMHVTIILSGIVVTFFDTCQDTGLLLLFMGLKALLDLYLHRKKNLLG